MLAVPFGMERFHTHVYKKQTIIETDHKSFISISRKKIVNAPFDYSECCSVCLQRYSYELLFVPGSRLILLVRCPERI